MKAKLKRSKQVVAKQNQNDMEQKRVSFKVARAVKDAGYPQNYGEGSLYYSEDGQLYEYSSELFPIYPNVYCVCIAYLSVWLWLWREKKIHIDIDSDICDEGAISYEDNTLEEFEENDPEEAIIAAVEYLVDNNLIK